MYKKRIITLSVAAFAVFVLAGCSHQAAQESAPAQEDAATMMNDEGGDASVEDMDDDQAMDAEEDADAKVFTITGKDFAFSQTEMVVNVGDTVVVNFESTQGFHDWAIDAFDAKTEQVSVGTPTSVTFVADQAGTFEYYCSVGKHRENGMVGTLIVQ